MTAERFATRKVLYVEGNVDGTIGGSYFSLFFLAAGLDRSRFEPAVAFARDTAMRARFHDAGVPTRLHPPPVPVVLRGRAGRLAAKALNLWKGAVAEPLRIAALLRREQIDLVHLNNSIVRNHTWMIGARIAGIPCITHERGINARFKTRDHELGRRLAAVVCISSAVRENFLKLGLSDLPLVTIHNGLDPEVMRATRAAGDLREELGIPDGARIVGVVGNVKPWKGQETVIRALAMLREEFPQLVCLLIGDTSPGEDSYRAAVERLALNLGLGQCVKVTGFRADVANYVNLLEVQIHASIAPEPFGRVLLEAMALGKPLVASGAGAVPEIVLDGETGLLFEPGNATSLAEKLRTLLRDPARGEEYGRRGRLRLEQHFSIRHNIDETQALYDRLLAAGKTSRIR